MLRLSKINIFPVKSLDGYSPDSAIVERRGLQFDRRWLITGLDGVFMTLRTHPRMALLKAVVENGVLAIFEKENAQNCVKIPVYTEGGIKNQEVEIWDDRVAATVVSADANAFLSNFLNKKCQLVTMPSTTDRPVEAGYNTGNDVVSFADGYPFLIIGEASLTQLNEKIGADAPLPISSESAISMRRFRTNFVFSGGEPFEEDGFKNFKIGNVDFVGLKPCARCVMTTRDPDTGVKGKEPLQTLSQFRQVGHKILFGQNLVWNDGLWQSSEDVVIRIGDIISI